MVPFVVVVGLIVFGLLMARMLQGEPPPPEQRRPTDTKTVLGPYYDIDLALLPNYVRPGHGFLVLRDRTIDQLLLDGFDAGNPDSQVHHFFTGGFRGYFNVPPGVHVLVARSRGRESTWTVDVAPNAAYVRRMDWDQGGWVEDTPETTAQYIALARSGSLLEAKALRPWPLVSLFFLHAPPGLMVNGKLARAQSPFSGVVNLQPGVHRIETSAFNIEVELTAECMSLIDFGTRPPTFIDPKFADLMVRLSLARAPLGAIVSAERLATSVSLGTAVALAQDTLAAMTAVLGAGTAVREFGDADLAEVERSFAVWRASPSAATLGPYLAALRVHYIYDQEMAKQAPYFTRYGEAIVRHVQERPDLLTTDAGQRVRYLAQDLIDTEVESCSACGRVLQGLVGR